MKLLKILLALSVIMIVYSCVDDDQLIADSNFETEERQDEIPGFEFPHPCDAANLTFFVNPNCDGTVYTAAIAAGILAFNNAPTGLFFTEVPTAAAADIVIDCVDGDGCGEGVTNFVNGTIDLEIMWENCLCIDDPANCNFTGTVPACMFTRTVMHEIGHAVGIHHNGEGDWIPGTPNTGNDPLSVFNSGPINNANCTWCTAPCVFNAGDLAALTTLYPPCGCVANTFLRGPADLCIEEGLETGTVTYCVSPLPQGTSLFEMDGTPINGNCFDFSYDQLGTYTAEIQICVDNTGCCRTLSRSVVVFDDNCCSTCYCECDELIDRSYNGSTSIFKKFGKEPKYRTVRHVIPCWDNTPCEEIYPTGDEFFDCEKIIVTNELSDLSITGDEVLCWDEEGRFCINGLPSGTGVDWIIHGPNGSFSDSSSGGCLYITFSDIGTYTVTAEIFEGECSQVFSHTVEYKNCEEKCYCICEEGDGEGNYETVELPIDCNEDCSEQYPVGDEYFDCKKVVRDE